MDISDELIYEIEMNAWRELGAQRAKEREEAKEGQGMIAVAVYCDSCEKEIETVATYEGFTNSISYVCTSCGETSTEGNWEGK